MTRSNATILHRLRLGYRCHWEIAERFPKECQRCHAIVEEPLLHYVLCCPVLDPIRPQQYSRLTSDTPLDPHLAAECVKTLLSTEESFNTICQSPSPR